MITVSFKQINSNRKTLTILLFTITSYLIIIINDRCQAVNQWVVVANAVFTVYKCLLVRLLNEIIKYICIQSGIEIILCDCRFANRS